MPQRLTLDGVLEGDLYCSSGGSRGTHSRPCSTTAAALFCRPAAIRRQTSPIRRGTAINRQSLRRPSRHSPCSASWLWRTWSAIHRGSKFTTDTASWHRRRHLLLTGLGRAGGTGTICRKITASHGTSLWVKSQLLPSTGLLHSQSLANHTSKHKQHGP